MMLDAVIDSAKLIPFLFLTYLVMEYLEHKTGEGTRRLIRKMGRSGQGSSGRKNLAEKAGRSGRIGQAEAGAAWGETGEAQGEMGAVHGKMGAARGEAGGIQGAWRGRGGLAGFGRLSAGPVAGGLLGVIPQCGFSAAASNLYAGRVITLGTLLAVYLSTSDEMLPILISERAPMDMILKILLAKAVIGIGAGIVIDLLSGGKDVKRQECIHDICEQEKCHCERGIFRSALAHTLQIAFFILAVSLGLNFVLGMFGEDALAELILHRPILAPVLAGIVGLIPNCAGSVVLTQLYLKGAMGMGALMAGLLANSGVGMLVLFRVNHNKKENLKILGLVYGIGVVLGIGIGIAGIG